MSWGNTRQNKQKQTKKTKNKQPPVIQTVHELAKAAVLGADDKAGRLVKVHDARRRAVDAHLLFEATAHQVLLLAERAVSLRQKLGHDEERDALPHEKNPSRETMKK
jgi:hypothetical protein